MEKWKNGKKLQTTNLRLVIGDCLLPTVNWPLPTSLCPLRFALCKIEEWKVRNMECGM